MPYHSFILSSVFVNGAPCALLAKTKKQPITRAGDHTFESSYILASSLGIDGEGRCLRFETSAFNPYHVLCQLGSGLDNVDGVKAVFLE